MEAASAPYGRACVNCFKSKCKCVVRPEGNGCQRCHRLKKQCVSSDSIRKRPQRDAVTRTAHLEEKLDGLVSLLQSVAQSAGSSAALNDALNATRGLQGANTLSTPVSSSSHTTTSHAFTPTSVITPSVPATEDFRPETLSAAFSTLGLTDEEAEERLTIFRDQMLKYFPFIHLPRTISARQLHNDRPFLFRCIAAVATPSTQQRLASGRNIKQELAQRMVIDNEVSIDLLLGILVFSSWSHDQFLNKTMNLSRFTQFAMSVVYDLQPFNSDAHMLPKLASSSNEISEKRRTETGRTLEHRRGALACFLLSSLVSSYFSQIDPMRWTAYMEESLRILQESEDCPADEVLNVQIRLQLLLHRANQMSWPAGGPETDTSVVPPAFYLKALQSQLQQLKSGLSLEVQQNDIIMTSLYYTEISIHEMALSRASLTFDNSGFQRLESLCACLAAIKSWMDIFLKFPPLEYAHLSFTFWAQLMKCIVVLYRLSTWDDPAWDKQLVRDTLDVVSVMEQITSNMEQLSTQLGERSNDEMIIRAAKFLRCIQFGCSVGMGVATADQPVDEFEMLQDPMLFDYPDSVWLRDMFGFSSV